jgi:AraC-like DNA-binding protein
LKKRADVASAHRGGVGRVYVWDDASLFIGQGAGAAQPHAHHALQLTVSLDAAQEPFVLHAAGAARRGSRFALVPADLRHVFDGRGGRVAHVFVAPESREGRSLTQRFGSHAIVDLAPGPQARAIAAWNEHFFSKARDDGRVIGAARDLIAHLAQAAPAATLPDPRVARMRAHIGRHLGGKLALADVARAVHLSPGRLRHLFVEETGTTFRAYVVWQRLLRATSAMMEGASWTDAAHAAGFADSAHLSRSFRRMFGVSPRDIVSDVGKDSAAAPTATRTTGP